MTDDHWWKTNLFYFILFYFRTLFVPIVIISRESCTLELKSLTCKHFCMNRQMVLWNAEPLNNADLKLEYVLFYSKGNLRHTQTSELCLCPFVPIACYDWHSIQIKTLFTAKENYLAVLVLFSLRGMNDDWAMGRGRLIAPGALKKNWQLTTSFRDERRVNVTIYNVTANDLG